MHGVGHVSGEVANRKSRRLDLRKYELLAFFQFLAISKLGEPAHVGASDHLAMVRQEVADLALLVEILNESGTSFDEVDAGLIVVEVDPYPGDLLPFVFLLFQFEHVLSLSSRPSSDLIELLLELLVGEVDGELLEAIHLEGLEAATVQGRRADP